MMLRTREFKCIQRLGPYYESSHNLPVSTHCVNIDLNLALLPGIWLHPSRYHQTLDGTHFALG